MTCGRTQYLEAMVSGETPALEADLRAHAQGCALCRHELSWLQTERGLCRQRASREEVSALWKGVALRSGAGSSRPWPRVLVGLAASALLFAGLGGVGRIASSRGSAGMTPAAAAEEPNESEPLSSEQVFFPSSDEPCSKLPTGLGFHCGPAVPASFVASL
jgi:hypothetical protein